MGRKAFYVKPVPTMHTIEKSDIPSLRVINITLTAERVQES